MTLELTERATHDLVLVIDLDAHAGPTFDVDRAWAGTETAWRDEVPELPDTVATRDARHAYAVLSGLTSSGGGMVAAATMALPERARAGRSYDYRYVWIRDQCLAGQAVAKAGPYPLLDDAVRFVSDRLLADGAGLVPAYTVNGDPVPRERNLGLAGYPGGTDIAGNRVTLADAIAAQTATEGVHPSGRWQRSPGDSRVDAALLLPANPRARSCSAAS